MDPIGEIHMSNNFFLAKILKRTNFEVKKFGLKRATNSLLKKIGAKLFVHSSPGTDSVLKNYPVVVAANHPAEADVLAILAALPHRSNTHLIVNSSFLGFGKNIDKHLIPVHINHRLFKYNWLNLGLRLFTLIHRRQIFDQKTSHLKNIASINLASRKIKEDGLIVMFPAAGSTSNKWFSGIGYLIKNARQKKTAQVVMAYIRGTSKWDYLRVIPGFSKLLPPFEVYFSEPKSFLKLIDSTPKEIAGRLGEEFSCWEKELNQKKEIIGFHLPRKAYLFLRSVLLWFLTNPPNSPKIF